MPTCDQPPFLVLFGSAFSHASSLRHRMDTVALLAKTSRNGAERCSDVPGSTCAQGINFCSGPLSCRFCICLDCERSLKTRQEITHDHPGDAVDSRIRGRSKRQDPGLSLIHISEPTRLGMISYAV